MKPLLHFFKTGKQRAFMATLSLFLLIMALPREARADISFKEYHVKFMGMSYDNGRAFIDFHILCQDWDGYDDELDDIILYYLDPNTKQWVKFFKGDFDDGNRWDCHFKTDLVYHSPSSNGNWHNGDRYGQILFYPPENLFPGYIIFKAEVDWDIDSNDNNTGIDDTFYYKYINNMIPSTTWESLSSYSYDINDNNYIEFTFPITELYGDGVVASDKQERHELDDILVQYKDANGSWQNILHGDCDNSRYDIDFQIFSNNTNANVSTYSVGNRHYAKVKSVIDPSIIGGDVTFRYAYKWDLWADVINTDPTAYKEFTVNTFSNYQLASNVSVVSDYDRQFPQNIFTWKVSNHANIDHIDVRRDEYINNEWTGRQTIATYTSFDYDGEYSIVNSMYEDDDETSNNDYLIRHGAKYLYWVDVVYKNSKVNSTYDNDQALSSEVLDMTPEVISYSLNSATDDQDKPQIIVKWGEFYRTESYDLYKKTGSGNFEKLTLTSTDRSERQFQDANVSGCVNYEYKLEMISPVSGSEQPQTNSISETKLLNTGLTNALVELDVSKGYYDERVVLKWTNNGGDGMDRIKVLRRQLKYDNAEEEIIAVLDATDNTYIDETALSGTYYEYTVYGEGKCGDTEEMSESQILQSIGFCQRTGIVSGQITYDAGTAVEGVRVALESSNENQSSGSSIYNNSDWALKTTQKDIINTDDKGFTIEGWYKTDVNSGTLFECIDSWPSVNAGFILYQSIESGKRVYNLKFSGSQYSFSVDSSVYTSIGSNEKDYNHWALSYSNNKINVYCNAINVLSETHEYIPVQNNLFFGYNYKGFIDEIRIWNKAKSQKEIEQDFTRLLSGTEEDLELYWRLDEGLGSEVYDMTNHNGKFNKNHGVINGDWSSSIPSSECLALVGLTNEDGYYIIDGIRYSGTGETFKVTPMLGVHEFSPKNRTMFIGNSSLTQNDKDFDDISSFKVKGKIVYEGTNFPVKNVYIKVDGVYVQGEGAMPVMSNVDGTYVVDVPIGEHYIELEKEGHTFLSAFFPQKDESGVIQYHTFEAPLDMVNFYDNTTVKLIGKVVGGAVEGGKQTASIENPAVNNIGQVSITLTSDNRIYNLPNGKLDTTIITNAEDGNFVVELLPEVYKPIDENVGVAITSTNTSAATTYTFNEFTDMTSIDLSNCFRKQQVVDSIFTRDNFGELQFVKDTVVCEYNKERNWVYRSTPELKVTNMKKGQSFGESTLPYPMSNGESANWDAFTENPDGSVTYHLGHPVFNMGNPYGLHITAFEKYTNADNGAVDEVPVTDGKIKIDNECAADNKNVVLDIEEDGSVDYTFGAGMPNLASPYLLAMDVNLIIGSEQFQWEKAPLNCYVLGSQPTGSNFVTQGPDEVDYILRDPAGSNSYAYLEKGSSITSSTSSSIAASSTVGASASLILGSSVGVHLGIPFFHVQTTVEIDNTTTLSTEVTSTSAGETSYENTVTYNKSYSTSEAADYVGAMGDIFFGRSTNIIYGLANSLEIMPIEEVIDNTTIIKELKIDDKDYALAQKQALRFSPEVSTTFIYTQNHIEEALIPNLKLLRNLFYSSHPNYYTLNFNDSEDDKFLSNNDDAFIWGSEASNTDDRFDGPSYTFHAPVDAEGNLQWDSDTVRFYNKQIKLWEEHLAANEKQKLKAEAYSDSEFPSNISFDAGAGFEASVTTFTSEAKTSTYEIELNAGFSNSTGMTVNNNGLAFEIATSVTGTSSKTDGKTVEEETTVGFVLADEDAGDYFSVDVLKCKAGNGPVFRTRGGQSSCPYEGAETTKYYKPGTIISDATMQIEQPHIRVERSLITGVPENDEAYFTIELSNTSETGDDGWYNLIVDSESNPYGATVKLDGAAMVANGKQILIPAGQTVYKTIAVTKGRSDIDEYDDIKLILHSQCQYDPTDFVDDIYDEVTISAHFVPACSPVELLTPMANWVVNKGKNDKMNVTLAGYNLQHDKMQSLAFQYKAASASTWTTVVWWVNNQDLTNKDNIEDTLYINDAATVSYTWDMSGLSDRKYDVRAISICDNEVYSFSETMTGTLDGKEPKIFGTPQPADGILSTGEDISIYFDEEIEAGLVNSSNITVKGVLNGYATNHDVSVQLDGANATIESGDGIQLANRSFAMEFWFKASDFNKDGNILSYGFTETNGLALAMKDGKMQLSMNGLSESFACATNTTWHHYAISYNAIEEKLYLIQDDGALINGNMLTIENVPPLENNATLIMGANSVNNAFAGNIHDLRVWSKALSAADVYADMYTILNGQEMGLMSYYRMDEAFGTLIEDKASARHAVIDGASWAVNPKGKSYQFNGNNALLADISAIPVTADGDMTIEFWMKANATANNSTLLSNGTPETAAEMDKENILAFSLNNEGILKLASNGQLLSSNAEMTDDMWHHVALVVKRTANAKLYIDGDLASSVYGTDFGAFGSSKLAIGALKDNSTDATSNYFKGQMDEIRIWHSARPIEILSAYRNARVDSKDLGLKAYFPFETYEKNIFDFYESKTSSADQSHSIYDNASYCGACTLVGGESFSDLTPNIKRDRELSEVNCDIAVNVDKIVITPTDPDSKLENCVLEISVDGIYDKYENKMASAATWTAYVDRNTVTWTEDEIELAKEVNGEITFNTYIRNAGGTYESYSIENLPAWLEANPVSGIIAPDDDEKITFTVHSGLNIGSFNEDLYLKTDFGFDERMNIDLRVNGEAPVWAANTGDLSETMSFVGRVKIKDQTSKDVEDIVAVFAGDECRGVANVKYYSEIDEYLLMLTVFGDMNGEDLSYRVYDAGSGEIYTSCSVDSAFIAQMVYGSVVNPVVFDWDELVKNNIPLQEGWNWISFNSTMDHYNSLNEVMANVKATNGDRIKDATAGNVSQYYQMDATSSWVGTVNIPNNDAMYQCYIANGGNLIYDGVPLSPKDYAISIGEGWNRISYIPNINLEINEALSAYEAQAEDVIKSQLAFAMYTGFSWIGSLEYMEPGKGYMLKRATDSGNTSFKYPTASTFVSSKSSTVNNTYEAFGLNPYDYESATSMIARVNGISVTEGAYLLAYIGKELRGVTALQEDIVFISIFGNESELNDDITFKVQALDQEVTCSSVANFNSSIIYGTTSTPFEIDTEVTGLANTNVVSQSLEVYPNPISDVVNVAFSLEKATEINIEVYNTLGQCVYTTPTVICKTGQNTLEWNASALPEGLYTLSVNIGNKQHTVKLSKIK